ncbi:MAG: magnesium/cobalt transporter CorA [Candidatus Omnitrophica bacterium]|nr:magnesium/cobalt transporter CorA [Candidatus Omnitrophota bacterium]
MLNIFYLDPNKKFHEDLNVDQIQRILQDKQGILWVDMRRPDEKELKILSDVFNFHPLAIDDCSHYTDLPKIDEFEDHVFIVIHSVLYDKESSEIKKPELDIFLSKNFVVTVHEEGLKTIDINLDKVRKNPHILSKGADFLLYNIIDVSVDNYMPLLDYWDDKIEELEDEVLSGKIGDVMPKIIDMKRNIIDLRRSITPQRDVINKLARRDSQLISAKNVIYFRDIYDHIARIHELLEADRDLIAGTFEIYLSAVSNRMNEIMKRLTIVATIFMPLTLIAGVYGMNFNPGASHWNMPELNWAYGYVFVIGLMILITLGMMVYFKRKKWF